MPTRVQKRSGQYPIRVSLNVTVETSDVVDYLERATGELRGVIIRESLNFGLVLYNTTLERRRRQEARAAAAAAGLSHAEIVASAAEVAADPSIDDFRDLGSEAIDAIPDFHSRSGGS